VQGTELIWLIAGIGIIVAILGTVLKMSGRDEQAQLLTLVAVVTVLSMVLYRISDLFSTARAVFRM